MGVLPIPLRKVFGIGPYEHLSGACRAGGLPPGTGLFMRFRSGCELDCRRQDYPQQRSGCHPLTKVFVFGLAQIGGSMYGLRLQNTPGHGYVEERVGGG